MGKPWFVSTEKELFGFPVLVTLHGAVTLRSRWLALEMSKVIGMESSMRERKKIFLCNFYYLTCYELGHPGWKNCAELWKSHIEPHVVPGGLDLTLCCVFGTRWVWSGMGRSSHFHPQRLIIHVQSLLLFMLVFWNKSIHVCSCRVFLALQQLAPNPPARQLTREEEESWPQSLRKAEIMDFRGGSPSLNLQFHLSWQDLKSCKYHASKVNLPGETQIIFFFTWNEGLSNNLQHFYFASNLILGCFIYLLFPSNLHHCISYME